MRTWRHRLKRLDRVLSNPTYLRLVGQVPTWRLMLATALAGFGVVLVAHWARSAVIGYAYGGLLFLLFTWPLGLTVWRSLRWTEATVGQSLLLALASWAMGTAATLALGFNPQAARLSRMRWPEALHLLWQFPLVLPVENLVLLGGLISLWQWVRPLNGLDRLMVAATAAFLFGLWHVPAWGGWTMVVIGLTVLPWAVYLMATGDFLAPMLAHIWLDVMAVVSAAAASAPDWRRFVSPGLFLVAMLVGLSYSLYRDWRHAGRQVH
jgi:hypothetical protein